MNVVDSSGWLEYFSDGKNAEFFSKPLSSPATLVVPAISIYEVFKRVLQQRDESAALAAAALMQQGRVVNLDAALGMSAARLSVEHKLPMADSIILATARQFKAVVWTQDEDFAGLQDVKYMAKPRSSRS